MKINNVILDATLKAYSHGEPCEESYRAVLVDIDSKPVICVEQPITRDNVTTWHSTGGRWYLSTLMEGKYSSPFTDAISIDYGQQWSIVSGLREAIQQAALIIVQSHS